MEAIDDASGHAAADPDAVTEARCVGQGALAGSHSRPARRLQRQGALSLHGPGYGHGLGAIRLQRALLMLGTSLSNAISVLA